MQNYFNEARNMVYDNLKYIGATCTQGMKQPKTNKIDYQRFLLCWQKVKMV